MSERITHDDLVRTFEQFGPVESKNFSRRIERNRPLISLGVFGFGPDLEFVYLN
jgi:hypothetical protein